MGMAAIAMIGPFTFVQMFNPILTEGSTWSLKRIGPGFSEENLFKGVDGRRGRRKASDHSSWAEGELKSGLLLNETAKLFSKCHFSYKCIYFLNATLMMSLYSIVLTLLM